MKNLKAYTLLEVLVVMSIMVILMGLSLGAYASFTETTKFNQDIADLQNDILVIQRAAMLLDREPDEDWIYGIGIDFEDVYIGNGTYEFFKWCSEFEEFGNVRTKSQYPSYDPEHEESTGNGTIPNPTLLAEGDCTTESNRLTKLSGYGSGNLNLKDDVSIPENGSNHIRFLLFESVTGRAFLYWSDGTRVTKEAGDLTIVFSKNYGESKELIVENLTGRTKIIEHTSP
jgi:prepilin-type N-terminal cleavage/methylation domain-containing protein